MKRKWRQTHDCVCGECNSLRPDANTQRLDILINCFLATQDERGRRLFAGLFLEWNSGNMGPNAALQLTAAITGLSPRTIQKGLTELKSNEYRDLADDGRARRTGGGRKPAS